MKSFNFCLVAFLFVMANYAEAASKGASKNGSVKECKNASRSVHPDEKNITIEQLREIGSTRAVKIVYQFGKVIPLEKLKVSDTEKRKVRSAVKKLHGEVEENFHESILKGEYELTGKLKTEEIDALVFKGEVYGYRVRVSAKAKSNYEDAESTGSISSTFFMNDKFEWDHNIEHPDYSRE